MHYTTASRSKTKSLCGELGIEGEHCSQVSCFKSVVKYVQLQRLVLCFAFNQLLIHAVSNDLNTRTLRYLQLSLRRIIIWDVGEENSAMYHCTVNKLCVGPR
jgi:hypothetical protein